MKHLKIGILTTKWGKFIRVVEQTHRQYMFGKDATNTFMASNGFRLCSFSFSDASEDNTMFVRGSDEQQDSSIFMVPSDEWLDKLRVAVREYNQTFSDTPKIPDEEIIE